MKRMWCVLLALLLPLSLIGCSRSQKTSLPKGTETVSATEAQGVYRIVYEFALRSNDRVGNAWETSVTCNGKTITSGDTIAATSASVVTIEAFVTESDNIPDSGSGAIRLPLEDGASSSVRISVRENRGRYAGRTAVWELVCSVKRIR